MTPNEKQHPESRGDAETAGSPERKVPILLIGMALIGLAAGGYLLDRRMTPHLTAGPMVQLVSADSLMIVWETVPRRPGRLIAILEDESETSIDAEFRGRHYIAELTGLSPRTKVSYRIEHRGFLWRRMVLAEASTRCAPERAAPVRFLAFGDSGGGTPVQAKLAERMIALDPDLIIHTGDLVYLVGAQRDYLEAFYRPYADLICSVPFYPILGNHDTKSRQGQPFLDNFELPANGPPGLTAERSYAFEYGDALFVGVDSTVPQDTLSAHTAPWVTDQLRQSSARWKFVFLHHPPYSGGDMHGSSLRVRDSLVPAFEQGGADVVFCGHEHHYERTAPLLKNQVVDEGGVVYVVTGAGGVSLYAMADDPPEYVVAHNDKKYSFTLVELDGDSLRGMQIDDAGRTLDEWRMTKRR